MDKTCSAIEMAVQFSSTVHLNTVNNERLTSTVSLWAHALILKPKELLSFYDKTMMHRMELINPIHDDDDF